ncbi:hypothetical protein ACQEVB_04225 [Pseudonocardia sp. CA-107938]|uniref:hypothetical protein n=1 Tax=Pseudonocardia sp. CA-107938 TaxID=3240021 RepID=UPI003D8BF4CD
MSSGTVSRRWWAPVGVGVVLVVVFVALVTVSATLRQYWPFLVLSALVAAVPFLLRSPAPARRPLPVVAGTAAAEQVGEVALRASAVSVPKISATGGENEDAYAVDADAGYAAVADGASASFGAADWARTLCETFVAQRPLDGPASASWIGAATSAFVRPTGDGADWWSADAARRGAHAAFVGLAVLRAEQGLVWRATAVGDCVLVHLRPDGDGPPIVTAFPVDHSASFPQNPVLLSSEGDGRPPVRSIDGTAAAGDAWLLMSDELARWALRRYEVGEPVWDVLVGGSAAQVRALIGRARSEQGVADDDMTVVRCQAG